MELNKAARGAAAVATLAVGVACEPVRVSPQQAESSTQGVRESEVNWGGLTTFGIYFDGTDLAQYRSNDGSSIMRTLGITNPNARLLVFWVTDETEVKVVSASELGVHEVAFEQFEGWRRGSQESVMLDLAEAISEIDLAMEPDQKMVIVNSNRGVGQSLTVDLSGQRGQVIGISAPPEP